MEWASMVTIGRIVRPHGHRGQVVVVPESDFADERFTVSEKFTEFETTPAGTVPRAWAIDYVRTGARTDQWKYECKLQSVASGSPAAESKGGG